MAKRNSGSGGLILAAFIWCISTLFGFVAANIVGVAAVTIVIFVIYLWINSVSKKRRIVAFNAYKQALFEKYKNNEVVQGILNSEFWVGQTTDQLEDSLGSPSDIDKTVLKTKTKELWKYHEIRKGQFQLRINIENGKVIGWSGKSN